jgi:2-polyprenyl-3-methyl-5-hydroxy-6-metoxy-1,4-benzoquinol methylase
MLSSDYHDDGISLMELNDLQLKLRDQVNAKVEDGTYSFESVPCAVCGGSHFEQLAEKDRYGLSLSVVICKDCGLIQTNPRMTQESYNEFYNEEYRALYMGKEIHTQEFFEGQCERGRELYDFIASHGCLNEPESKLVLEVGCGAGGILHSFREKGCSVIGVELGRAYVEYGKEKYDLNLISGTLHTVDFHRRPNVVIYNHVIEHILTINEELQRLHEILADDGIVYLAIPSVKNLKNTYQMNFLRLMQNAHVYHFTSRTLGNLMKKNGFEVFADNEIVRGIYRKSSAHAGMLAIEDDYSDVMSFLRDLAICREVALKSGQLPSL